MSERSTFWLSHLSAIEAEGITTKAYAEREGLSPQALYQWRKRLVAGGRPAAPSSADSSRSRSNLR
jgi:transposase